MGMRHEHGMMMPLDGAPAGHNVIDASGAIVAQGCGEAMNAAVRARRIVACVNACDGIADPASLRAQRDELLAALRAAEDRLALVIECDTDDGKPECAANAAALAQARAAIARAEGSQ